ncbi:MAG: hypothetical protein WD942_10550 [Dehalococcoidia bacterium]
MVAVSLFRRDLVATLSFLAIAALPCGVQPQDNAHSAGDITAKYAEGPYEYQDGAGMIGFIVLRKEDDLVDFRPCSGAVVTVSEDKLAPTEANCQSEPDGDTIVFVRSFDCAQAFWSKEQEAGALIDVSKFVAAGDLNKGAREGDSSPNILCDVVVWQNYSAGIGDEDHTNYKVQMKTLEKELEAGATLSQAIEAIRKGRAPEFNVMLGVVQNEPK